MSENENGIGESENGKTSWNAAPWQGICKADLITGVRGF